MKALRGIPINSLFRGSRRGFPAGLQWEGSDGWEPSHAAGSSWVLGGSHNVKRIILFRHGESEAVDDPSVYCRVPDWKIPLSQKGQDHIRVAGEKLSRLIAGEPCYFYVSPYVRSQQTLSGLLPHFLPSQIVGSREDSRLRACDVDLFPTEASLKTIAQEKQSFGPFFYRYPNGESAADVCDRISSFLDGWDRERKADSLPKDTTMVLISHTLVVQLFVMRWFHLTVDTFHGMHPLHPCDWVTLERSPTHPERFRMSAEDLEKMNIPSSLNSVKGYENRNRTILGSTSLGAPYL